MSADHLLTPSAWRQLFRATWNQAKTHFDHLLNDLRRQKELLETQATLIQFRESKELRVQWETQFERAQEMERKSQYRWVLDWLRAENVDSDQERYSRIWQESNSCQWILKTPQVSAWRHPDNNSTPVLWLCGIPGSGKYSALQKNSIDDDIFQVKPFWPLALFTSVVGFSPYLLLFSIATPLITKGIPL